MRKERYITRTIITTDCTVLGINIDGENGETVERRHINLADKHENNARTFELCKKANDDDNFIPSKIMHIDYHEALYGCTVEDFLMVAHVLPPRTKIDTIDDDGDDE